MRSTIKTLAVATFALSLATGGAFAAENYAPHWPAKDGAMSNTVQHQTMSHVAPAVHKPRLSHVLAELHSADRTLQHDKAMGKLSAATVRRLEADIGSLRHRAMRVAEAHHGAIPMHAYHRLQQDIRMLDRNIGRLV